jgi:hypothetical protein
LAGFKTQGIAIKKQKTPLRVQSGVWSLQSKEFDQRLPRLEAFKGLIFALAAPGVATI